VLVPPDVDWFCVEPVSHATNAVNLGRDDAGLVVLDPGQTLAGTMDIGATTLSGAR
jgi:aldose 1-epimerase